VTTFTCSQGHTSTAGDYCDVCGSLIDPGEDPGRSGRPPENAPRVPVPGDVPERPAPPGGPAFSASAVTCPICGVRGLPGALFCEDCGYDFTTGQRPEPRVEEAGAAVFDLPMGGPSPSEEPAAPEPAAEPTPRPTEPMPQEEKPEPLSPPTVAPPLVPPAPPTAPPGGTGPSAPAPVRPASRPPLSPPQWVAEIWVDPDWYALQEATDPCPSAGMPVIAPLGGTIALIGRRSTSRRISPEVNCGMDTGVSRKHAILTTDGTRWWVEDLQSANGTFIGGFGQEMPQEPIPSGQRIELAENDRVYVGAWTRIVVRQALPGEVT
jgi:hypothetical protein